MIKTALLAELFNCTTAAINKWRKEKRKSVEFFDKYFNNEDIIEFLENNSMQKIELIKDLKIDQLKMKLSADSYDENNIEIIVNFKLSTISNSAKSLMIDQLQYCLENEINFDYEFAEHYYKNQFTQAIENLMSVFKLSIDFKPSYIKKDKEKYLFFIKNILTNNCIISIYNTN